MRKFKCFDCQHTWELPHGEGGRGIDLVCPHCGGHNVHRLKTAGRWGRRGRRRGQTPADSDAPATGGRRASSRGSAP